MDTFDRIIKEKLEQQHYAYKPSAWKNFSRITGIKKELTLLRTIGIIGTVAIISSGILIWIHTNHQESISPVQPENTFTEILSTKDDTLSPFEENTSLSDSFLTEQPIPKRITTPKRQLKESKPQVETIQQKMPSPNSKTKEGKWQISIINPDTIKEN